MALEKSRTQPTLEQAPGPEVIHSLLGTLVRDAILEQLLPDEGGVGPGQIG